MQTVTLVGTGLIGSSFALALKAEGFRGRVFGVSSEASVQAALERGAIDEATTLEKGVPEADLVYLAQPIARIIERLPDVARLARADALVTDAGSTKRMIVARASECFGGKLFLGGHPMAGKEIRGAGAAEAELFRDRPYFLTPVTAEEAENPKAVEFRRWVERIGAKPVVLSAAEHDRCVAATSHLPQMLSTALACVLAEQPDAEALAASGGPGLADVTRLALSSYEIWTDILATNGDEIVRMLELMGAKIDGLSRDLDSSHGVFELGRWFAERVPRRTV